MARKSIKLGCIVQIVWVDSVSDTRTWVAAEEFDFNEHDQAMLHESTGFLINRTKEAVYLSMSRRVNEAGGAVFGGVLSIPLVAIKKMRGLTE